MNNSLFALETAFAFIESEGLTFSVVSGEAVVTGYSGADERIEIPEYFECYPVTEVRDNAFYNNDSLKEVCICDNVTCIGHHCFYACTSLEKVRLPSGLMELGEGCFCGCDSLESIELPDSLRALSDSCFRACGKLREITLPIRLERIGELCFSGCESLKEIKTGDSIAEIGGGAFFMCPELRSIRIPPSCKQIGVQALGYDCQGNEIIRNTELAIIGERGTAAHNYAAENGIRFEEQTEALSGAYPKLKTAERADLPFWAGAAVFGALTAALFRCFILHKSR